MEEDERGLRRLHISGRLRVEEGKRTGRRKRRGKKRERKRIEEIG